MIGMIFFFLNDTVYLPKEILYIDHMEKEKITGHHTNSKVIGCKTIVFLTIGFNGKNYIYPSGEFKIHD